MKNVHPKVIYSSLGAGTGAAVVVVVVYVLSLFGIVVPANVQDSLSVIVALVLAFVAGYQAPSPPAA